jgi:hypothetical protein
LPQQTLLLDDKAKGQLWLVEAFKLTFLHLLIYFVLFQSFPFHFAGNTQHFCGTQFTL